MSPEDLDALCIDEQLKTVIVEGRDAASPKRQDDSRSAWLFDAVRRLKGFDVPDPKILAIITDPKFKISASVVDKGRNRLAYARRQIDRATAEVGDPVLREFNAEHAVVENYGSKTVIISFDGNGKFFHRTFEDFKRSYDHRKVAVQRRGNTTQIGQGTAFIENPNRRQFKSVVFLPGKETEDGILNLYRGPSIEPKAGICDLFMRFVIEIICDGDEGIAHWLLNYIAHLYQRPWEPPEVCVILRGRQGVGKNFFVESIGSIVADYFITVSSPKHLVGSFNRHLMDKLVVFADEAFYGDERRHAGVLKNLVTQTDMTIEPKGVDVFMAKKYFRLLMASNEDFVVPADLDDRRYLVLDVSSARAKDHAYFGALREEWTGGGQAAFYDLMLKRDISSFNHRDRPETLGLVEQKVESLIGAERLMLEMLTSGEAPVPHRQEGVAFIATEALREQFAKRRLDVTTRALAIELELIALTGGGKRETVMNRQVRGFWVPTLRECREAWARAKRLPISWPDDDGEWIDTYWYDPI